MTIELHLYPAERLALTEFLSRHLPQITGVGRGKETVEILVLQEYVQNPATWNTDSWARRRSNKRFRFKMRHVVAKVLHQLMQQVALSPAEQLFLAQLDLALINLSNQPVGIRQFLLSQGARLLSTPEQTAKSSFEGFTPETIFIFQ